MRIAAIHQPQYLPYLGFFHKLLHCDIFVALDNVQFQKNGLQNRNKIKTSQGWQWLTVPVINRFGQLINEVRISPEVFWQRKHWSALVSNYSRAPYFDMYGPGVKDLVDREWSHLCDLNMALTRWTAEVLGIKTAILYSSALKVDGKQTEFLINICNAVEADCYLSGPGGANYMDLMAFEAAGITVSWQNFTAPVYEQLFPEFGFIPNLSIVDTLFNYGQRTIEFMQQGSHDCACHRPSSR